MVPIRAGHVWAGSTLWVSTFRLPTATQAQCPPNPCSCCPEVSGWQIFIPSWLCLRVLQKGFHGVGWTVDPGGWGVSGLLCRWEKVAWSEAKGEVCAQRWGEAALGSPQSLSLEFSELPTGMLLYIAADHVPWGQIPGLFSTSPCTWDFRSVLPNQHLPRYLSVLYPLWFSSFLFFLLIDSCWELVLCKLFRHLKPWVNISNVCKDNINTWKSNRDTLWSVLWTV